MNTTPLDQHALNAALSHWGARLVWRNMTLSDTGVNNAVVQLSNRWQGGCWYEPRPCLTKTTSHNQATEATVALTCRDARDTAHQFTVAPQGAAS